MPRPIKQREHREWFRPVSLGNRKSCPSCHARLGDSECVWSWGEYVCGKWRTVRHFCRECWPLARAELNGHAGGCGCRIALVGYHCTLPGWLTLVCPPEQVYGSSKEG